MPSRPGLNSVMGLLGRRRWRRRYLTGRARLSPMLTTLQTEVTVAASCRADTERNENRERKEEGHRRRCRQRRRDLRPGGGPPGLRGRRARRREAEPRGRQG